MAITKLTKNNAAIPLLKDRLKQHSPQQFRTFMNEITGLRARPLVRRRFTIIEQADSI